MALSLTEIEKILNTPSGVFLASSVCCDIQRGISHQLPDGSDISATTPSTLINELQTWYEKEIGSVSNLWKVSVRDEGYNQVRSFFAPQVVFASKVDNQKLLLDLVDYTHELTSQINK